MRQNYALSGSGVPCFAGVRGGNAPKGTWTPTVFGNDLPDLGIRLMNPGPYRPQTNGKLERLHRTLETEVGRRDGPGDFTTYYNEGRLHRSPDTDNRQTPLKAFRDKTAHDTIRADNPDWMEVGIHG